MELLERAKTVRLRSHHGKYLHADEDDQHVRQDRDAASPRARWSVDPVPPPAGQPARFVRLRGPSGRYLTASNEPFLLGAAGRKVVLTAPARRLDSSVEWEPLPSPSPAGSRRLRVRLRTRYGNFLRANAGLPPWRNSVTHDVPHRSATQDWILWEVELLEPRPAAPAPSLPDGTAVVENSDDDGDDVGDGGDDGSPDSSSFFPLPPPPPPPHLSKIESSDSFSGPLHKVEGRTIYYVVADDDGTADDVIDSQSFTFDGTSLEELSHRLEEVTGLSSIIICSRSPLNGKLYPLRLQLPPNNAAMHVVVVQESSKVGRTFQGD